MMMWTGRGWFGCTWMNLASWRVGTCCFRTPHHVAQRVQLAPWFAAGPVKLLVSAMFPAANLYYDLLLATSPNPKPKARCVTLERDDQRLEFATVPNSTTIPAHDIRAFGRCLLRTRRGHRVYVDRDFLTPYEYSVSRPRKSNAPSKGDGWEADMRHTMRNGAILRD